jgi:hypothetical protein
MDEKTSSSSNMQKPNDSTALQENARVLDEKLATAQTARTTTEQTIPETTELAGSEHRKAYGTAKTENLRDSEVWRYLLPTVVILGCAALLAVPLIILIPLFTGSLDANSHTHGLIWVWVTMIVLEVFLAIFIMRGLLKIFLTQAGNY